MTIHTTPRAHATVTGTTATFTGADGIEERLDAAGGEDIRHVVIRRAAEDARRTGASIELVTSGDRGDHHLLITADGDVVDAAPRPVATGSWDAPDEDPDDPPDDEPPEEEHAVERPSFIPSSVVDHSGVAGWRGFTSRLGITHSESKAHAQHREMIELVSRHWAGYRNIAVVNGKGGVGKTMTSAMIAAVFARYGGGNVLAWDNNDTRGTLGWRTEQGLYDTTIRDLIPETDRLLEATASVSDISRYVHHQTDDRYDVLRSNPELLASDQRISPDEFRRLLHIATHYYRLVIFDSGNDESADRWLQMIDNSHQLVVPTLTSPESAESAALLLEALQRRDARSAQLADNAVVVVTHPEHAAPQLATRVASQFAGLVRSVTVVPYDPALKSGPLRFDALRSGTRTAWIRVAAAIAAGLG